jgi:ParB family chromosome partitioning protein
VQKTVLGKGLASLLPGAPAVNPIAPSAPAAAPATPAPQSAEAPAGAVAAGPAVPAPEINRDRHMGISLAAPEEISANPYQPRRDFIESEIEELANSIRENGIIQPLVVRRAANGYQLIAGERRLRAAKKVGLKQVPIVIRRTTDREALELALIENIQRSDLNCIDEALAYFQLMQEFSLTQEEVSHKVGKERATVANSLRLLKLPEVVLDDLKAGKLSPGHGKVLLSVDDHEKRMRLRSEILEQHMSVRQSEARAQELNAPAEASGPGGGPSAPGAAQPVRTRLMNLSQDLTRQWSAKVEIKGNEKKGKIVIHYGTREELERLLASLGK